MQKLATLLARLDEAVFKATLIVCGALLTVMVAVAALGVFCRFVLHASLSWSEEFDAYLFVWLTCLGAAAGVKLRAHPEVRAIPDRLPAFAQAIVADFTDAAILVLGGILVVYGSDMITLMGAETASSLPISMVYPYLAIPVGGALLIWHSAVRIARAHLAPGTRQADAGAAGIVPEHI
jgi:TRAP-type C4-dicarboxylate transport system permease small subunit